MGNQASALGDGDAPSSSDMAARQLAHFDHTFKITLISLNGPTLVNVFGVCKNAERPAILTCKASAFEIVEEKGLADKIQFNIPYTEIIEVAWDHATSAVRLTLKKEETDDIYLIFQLPNSVEFEQEIKLRLSGTAAHRKGVRVPTPTYVGMFAGSTKPKPFQRKRPDITRLPSGKLPVLNTMRTTALEMHRGSYSPCSSGESRRLQLAVQHIHDGYNSIALTYVRGQQSLSSQWRPTSVLVLTDSMISYRPMGVEAKSSAVDFPFDSIVSWSVVDNENVRPNDSGINVTCADGDVVYFGVMHIRDLKHTLEYYWNKYQVKHSKPVRPGSTHGRPIVTLFTLQGEAPAPAAPVGLTEVFDENGAPIRPGQVYTKRQHGTVTSVATSAGLSSAPKTVIQENHAVKAHWNVVVKHQGWLLKKGGIGVGTAKQWIKRYFVLYGTSQGHFMAYYTDVTECPLYSKDITHRNVVDLAKATFIRPGSNRAESSEIPPNSFDIVTTEREWTLCAETPENMQRWLKLITRAVDEDVAILPDEELLFKVKAKADPTGSLSGGDYSTSVKVSAFGVSVTSTDPQSSRETERFFWVYTDFYKWSLLNQEGKLALCVNVFADATFSRRQELVFRTKEAVRLATAIEYFIEKFMTGMHVRLELEKDAEEQTPRENFGNEGQGLHGLDADEWQADDVQEVGGVDQEEDLLGFDLDEVTPPKPKPGLSSGFSRSFESGDSFGAAALPPANAPPPAPKPDPHSDLLGMDLLDIGPSPPTAPSAAVVSSAPPSNPFEDDFFGSTSSQPSQTPSGASQLPPLTANQVADHRSWWIAAIAAGGGPIYDDGILQIASKMEIRGSQARLTLFLRNQGADRLEELSVNLTDSAGLLRFEAGPLPSALEPSGQGQQVIMLECMKPAAPGPSFTVGYKFTDATKSTKTRSPSQSMPLSVVVTSFNEPLPLSSQDFTARWAQLTAAGLEAVEVCNGSVNSPLSPAVVGGALSSVLKFGRVLGMPDESDLVMYGSSVLRTGALATNKMGEMEKISVGCMIKLELNTQANALRISIRTLHPAATLAIMQTAKSLLL